MSAKRIIREIEKYSSFLITAHMHLEGDALGSELALASFLRKMGKTAYIVNNDATPYNYSFLPGRKRIRGTIKKDVFDAALIIDCAVKKRIGSVAELIGEDTPVITIDHHKDNKNFGRVNWVEPESSSTGEMIYQLFKEAGITIDRNDALNLYVAILTDTGSFRHANTTSKTFSIVSELLKFGINPAEIYAEIYESNSVDELSYVAKINSRISFSLDNRLAWVIIPESVYKKIKGKHEIFDKVLDFAKSIKRVKVVIIFTQAGKNFVKLSLRSKSPVDVQKFASIFDGGGHKYASGCIIKGKLDAVQNTVLKKAEKMLARYKI